MMEEVSEKITRLDFKVGIIGLGYVGLPLAREFLKAGFDVLGFDIDPEKVKKINRGVNYLYHMDGNFIKKFVDRGKLEATYNFSRLKEVDGIVICVPTPLGKHYEPDLTYVLNTSETIASNLREGHVVILESTTYPGTTEEEVLPILESSGLKVGKDFCLGYSPEREDPGNPRFTTSKIPKVVSGVTKTCLEVIDRLYSKVVIKTVPVSTPRVAEATKLLENIYRAVNIALVNELKVVFEKMGIDIWEVIEAAKTKPFGYHPFYPGPGLGGHCIPIDPFYLTWKAKEYSVHTKFIELSGETNEKMPDYVVERISIALNSRKKAIRGSRILIIGMAYKPDVGDLRESPSLRIFQRLTDLGAEVEYYDPYIPEVTEGRKYSLWKKSVELTPEVVSQFDLVAIITNHSSIDYSMIYRHSRLIVDTRNVYRIKQLQKGKIWKA